MGFQAPTRDSDTNGASTNVCSDNWRQVQDPKLKKRIQNRIAQRAYRRRLKSRLGELEQLQKQARRVPEFETRNSCPMFSTQEGPIAAMDAVVDHVSQGFNPSQRQKSLLQLTDMDDKTPVTTANYRINAWSAIQAADALSEPNAAAAFHLDQGLETLWNYALGSGLNPGADSPRVWHSDRVTAPVDCQVAALAPTIDAAESQSVPINQMLAHGSVSQSGTDHGGLYGRRECQVQVSNASLLVAGNEYSDRPEMFPSGPGLDNNDPPLRSPRIALDRDEQIRRISPINDGNPSLCEAGGSTTPNSWKMTNTGFHSKTNPEPVTTSTKEEKIELVMKQIEDSGFKTFDDFVAAYYVKSFSDSSSITNQQRLSRNKRLPKVLADVFLAAETWTAWERQGFHQSILVAAESILKSELRNARSRILSKVNILELHGRHGANHEEIAQAVAELQQFVQCEQPNLWSLLSTLAPNKATSASRIPLAALVLVNGDDCISQYAVTPILTSGAIANSQC